MLLKFVQSSMELDITEHSNYNAYKITAPFFSPHCEFYINKNELIKFQQCENALKLRNTSDEHTFLEVYFAVKSNNLKLYRGLPTCHFCIDHMKGYGVLKSEGTLDVPTFTMGGAKTCWLPTASDINIARVAAMQCIDEHTQYLTTIEIVPVGYVLEINVMKKNKICWLNSGEIVIQGPLKEQFKIKEVIYFESSLGWRIVDFPLDLLMKDIPRQRPYKITSREAVKNWYEECYVLTERLPLLKFVYSEN